MIADLWPFDEFCFDGFGSEVFFTIRGCFLFIKPCTGKNIHVNAFFVFRKMRGDGTCFNQLHERIAACQGIFMAEMRDKRAAVPFHMDDIVAQINDELPDFCPGGNGFQIASVEIQDEFLTIGFFIFRIW